MAHVAPPHPTKLPLQQEQFLERSRNSPLGIHHACEAALSDDPLKMLEAAEDEGLSVSKRAGQQGSQHRYDAPGPGSDVSKRPRPAKLGPQPNPT
jgi:hypothetical protein